MCQVDTGAAIRRPKVRACSSYLPVHMIRRRWILQCARVSALAGVFAMPHWLKASSVSVPHVCQQPLLRQMATVTFRAQTKRRPPCAADWTTSGQTLHCYSWLQEMSAILSVSWSPQNLVKGCKPMVSHLRILLTCYNIVPVSPFRGLPKNIFFGMLRESYVPDLIKIGPKLSSQSWPYRRTDGWTAKLNLYIGQTKE